MKIMKTNAKTGKIRRLLKNKKAAVGYFYANWPEIFAFIFLLVGAVLAATATSRIMTDIIVFFCGAVGGRLWFQKRTDLKFTLGLILVGFLVGFLIGNRYGGIIDTTLSYLFGIILSYNLHARKVLQDR